VLLDDLKKSKDSCNQNEFSEIGYKFMSNRY